MTDAEMEVARELWSRRARELQRKGRVPTSWVELDLVNEMYNNPLVSGSSRQNWLAAVARK